METHKQEYRIRDLSTKSVTLFPTRAQVVREIKSVVLKPGANEITVVGVTPTADEHSIKVEGSGSAIITDITVELLPNRDIFEEIYPETDDSEDDSDSDDEDDTSDKTNEALEAVCSKITSLVDEQNRAKEVVASAMSRLKILDAYGNSLDKKRGVDIEASIEQYRKERTKVFDDHMAGTVRDRDIAKEIEKLRVDQQRLERVVLKEKIKAAKAKAKVERAKAKIKDKERRRQLERQKEKTRIRKERENFWARYCYSVRITLDAASFATPASSRRNSIASASDIVKVSDKEPAADDDGYVCDLVLSYVTSCAFWSPSYDLALSTTANTALLCFDAQLTNMTSETWTNTKVTLSTSQTTFSGLQDAIPTLVPWRVKLGGRWTGGVQNDLVDSREERSQQSAWQASQQLQYAQKPRAQYFGVSEQPAWKVGGAQAQQFDQLAMYSQQAPLLAQAQAQAQLQAQQQSQMMAQAVVSRESTFSRGQAQAYMNTVAPPPPPPMPSQAPGGASFGFGGAPSSNIGTRGGGLFGSVSAADGTSSGPELARRKESKSNNVNAYMSVAKRKADARSTHSSFGTPRFEAEEEDADEAGDGDTILEPTPELSFQESSFEETGLTATYDLPNAKTLKPSSTASKQRVARISFSGVYFSHTVVAKYKPVAYLKAKLRNTSKLTLLKGPTGLTLDGTFLGRSTLPRCSAGDSFTLSLGVDPAIRVAYPKPDVKRSTTGVFTKGDNSVYTRTVTLVNTRAAAGKPVNITVLDQVPVSEDEKLRVEVSHPRGMYGGTAVATGVPGKDGKEEKDWGKAVATLKKQGEVSWDVVLNAGRSVRLTLEYDVSFPNGDRVVQV
ncbi:hypothetical protein QBC47DRAFT_357082 [Echria macrotheca]|uniref:Mucoidy inhibitor-like protein n=1 Tax=Echria macrotheca TaxID=438768 RepID=A0AAJ0FFJ3_9PEZI|nr:hypothetical protein QBC47DRAFT_357082 [Echria macrotheca]